MASGERVTFELELGRWSAEELMVRRVHGVEALSQPFRFEVEFVPVAGAPLPLGELPAAEASLCVRRPGGSERWVHGMCAAVELARVEAGQPAYRAVLVPRLLRLGAAQDSRVFQGMTAVEIVRAVLGQHGLEQREALSRTYSKRDLCIQYRETDLAFVSRLLEEEGIAYWFEHRSGGHAIVLGDAPTAFAPLPGAGLLPFRREVGGVALDEHVFALRRRAAVVPATVTLADFDFERPGMPVRGAAREGPGAEHYDHPSGSVQLDETGRRARVGLERLRFEGETWSGESTSHQLAPGFVFMVEGHPDAAFEPRLLVERVEHEGRQQTAVGAPSQLEDGYRNRFLAAPADRAYRPPARTRRARVHGPQTATVVGSPGEETHTDRHGRIKVQFHWDRLGRRDDTASGWVRLVQPWAGAGMGAVVVPRIGQEVLVRFLEGNPDRPVVTGAVYNGEDVPPVALPQERTRSTFRSDTSPGGGGGFNELAFEDQQGAEQVFLHGQKDEAIEVRNDKRQAVRAKEQLRVERDRERSVRGRQELAVGRTDAAEVNGNQTLAVRGHRATAVLGSFAEAVTGDSSVQVGGRRELTVDAGAVESVEGAATSAIGAAYRVNVVQAMTESVVGAKTVDVGTAGIESVGAAREERVGGSRESRVGGERGAHVHGHHHLDVRKDRREQIGGKASIGASQAAAVSSGSHLLRASRFSLVVAGRQILSLEKSGRVVLSGTSVSVNGKSIALAAPSISKIGPAAPGAGRAALEAARALAGAPAVARVRLVDQDGRPVVNEPFVVELSDGSTQVGMTNAQGEGQLPLPRAESFKLHFPRLEKSTWKKK